MGNRIQVGTNWIGSFPLQHTAAVSAWTWPNRFEIVPYRTIGYELAKLLCSDEFLRLCLGGSHDRSSYKTDTYVCKNRLVAAGILR